MKKWLGEVFGQTVSKEEAGGEEAHIVNLRFLETPSSRITLDKVLALSDQHENQPALVRGFIKILARLKQAQLMAAVPRQGQDKIPTYSSFNYLFQRMPIHSLLERRGDKDIELGKDIVLPWPWAEDRFESLYLYGSEVGEPWEFDDSNHSVEWFEPIMLGFVDGGNHSIMAGILAGEGSLPAENVYSLDRFYQAVTLDGDSYLFENERYPILDWDMATILELGRRLGSIEARDV